MTEAQFLAGLTGHDSDLHLAIAALRDCGHPFCLIGGFAVYHYFEPVVTFDADFAVAGSAGLVEAFTARGFGVESFAHSVNAQLPGSRLRLQITRDARYARFPARAVAGRVFGLDMPVACLEDLVQGKLWALADDQRRASKRAKDRADLIRLCESHAAAIPLIPNGMIPEVDAMRSR
jgi:hypothetical protein